MDGEEAVMSYQPGTCFFCGDPVGAETGGFCIYSGKVRCDKRECLEAAKKLMHETEYIDQLNRSLGNLGKAVADFGESVKFATMSISKLLNDYEKHLKENT